MPLKRFYLPPQGTWRGFWLHVAVIAIAALVVLGIADLFNISLDPLHRASPRPAPYQEHRTPSSVPEP
jgi:hypothetical protein